MIQRYKNQIISLAVMLQRLASEPNDLKLLGELQGQIEKRIKYSEKRVRYYKEEEKKYKKIIRQGGVDKQTSKANKSHLASALEKRKDAQKLIYTWRCFGDGIVFIYIDKWSVKPFFFNANDYSVKQESGALTGKQGARLEKYFVSSSLAKGIPVIRTDLTNCIRFGDALLLNFDEPFVVEIKTSVNKSARTTRQLDSLKGIHDYLSTDKKLTPDGNSEIIRQELLISERGYLDSFDDAISSIGLSKYVRVDVEDGTRLIAFKTDKEPEIDELLSELEIPIAHYLNISKMDEDWGIYYPFTLSIKNPKNLYMFIAGDVSLIVAFDFNVVKNKATEYGLKLVISEDKNYAFQITRVGRDSNDDIVVRISKGFLGRIFHELMSWDWILEEENARIEYLSELHTSSE